MCDLDGPFKFCSCSGKINKKKPYWVLNKSVRKEELLIIDDNDIDEIPRMEVIGTFRFDENDDKKWSIREQLLMKLNTKDVFDFNYKPCENDIIKIFDGKFKHHFIYSINDGLSNWEILDDGPFSNEKGDFKLTPKKKGFIKTIGL